MCRDTVYPPEAHDHFLHTQCTCMYKNVTSGPLLVGFLTSQNIDHHISSWNKILQNCCVLCRYVILWYVVSIKQTKFAYYRQHEKGFIKICFWVISGLQNCRSVNLLDRESATKIWLSRFFCIWSPMTSLKSCINYRWNCDYVYWNNTAKLFTLARFTHYPLQSFQDFSYYIQFSIDG